MQWHPLWCATFRSYPITAVMLTDTWYYILGLRNLVCICIDTIQIHIYRVFSSVTETSLKYAKTSSSSSNITVRVDGEVRPASDKVVVSLHGTTSVGSILIILKLWSLMLKLKINSWSNYKRPHINPTEYSLSLLYFGGTCQREITRHFSSIWQSKSNGHTIYWTIIFSIFTAQFFS